MANWFVGLPVDAGDWFAPLVADAPRSVRAFHPDDLHMTVAFLGSCGEERAQAAWAIAEAYASPGPFEVRLETLEPMGNPRRPSALSAIVSEGHQAAVAIMLALRDDMIAAAGARPENREPLPHITVARPGRKASAVERRAAVAWAQDKPPIASTLTIDRLALYTWSTERPIRQFRVVAARPL